MNTMSRKQKRTQKKNDRKDSKKEKESNPPENLVETDHCGRHKDENRSPKKSQLEQQLKEINEKKKVVEEELRREDEEKKRNYSGKNKGKNKGSGKKYKEKDTFTLMTEDILKETKASPENTNNSNSRNCVDPKNPLKSEIMNTFNGKTKKDIVEESLEGSADELGKAAKEVLLQKHLEKFSELMAIQPKRHTEAQIQMENRRLHESYLQKQNQELQKMRKTSVESMSKECPANKRQEYLKKQQEMERKRNQEEMNELQQSGAKKKAKSGGKGKNKETSASQNIPKKTWGPVPSGIHISPSDPVVWPTIKPAPQGNIWSERDRRQKQIQTLMPKTFEEEEEMMRQAIELSKKTAEEESQYHGIYDAEDDLMAKLMVNRLSMESLQLSEWISSSNKVKQPIHRNEDEDKSRLPPASILSPPIESTTNWDDWSQLKPKSPMKMTNPVEKILGSGKQQRMFKPNSSSEGTGKSVEGHDSWVSEDIAMDNKFQEISCTKALESHQELMESETRTGFSSMNSKFKANKCSPLVVSVDNDYYDPNGGARPKYTNVNSISSPPKYCEKEDKISDKKPRTSLHQKQNTPTVYKNPNQINQNNSNIYDATRNKSKGLQAHSLGNVDNLKDHPKENMDNNLKGDSTEDWNSDIDYVGPECDPDLKTTHLTYSGFHPDKFPKPQIIAAKLPKVNKLPKDPDDALNRNGFNNKSKETQQHYAFDPSSEDGFVNKSKEQGECYDLSAEDELVKSSREQVEETSWSSSLAGGLEKWNNNTGDSSILLTSNGKPITKMNEVQNDKISEHNRFGFKAEHLCKGVAPSVESSSHANTSRSVARGVRFMSARTKFPEAKSFYLTSRKQPGYSSLSNTSAPKRSGVHDKHSSPDYPKSLSKDLTGAKKLASMPELSCGINQSRNMSPQNCPRIEQRSHDKQNMDTVLCSSESQVKSGPAIPNLPKSSISSKSYPEIEETQSANDEVTPINIKIPVGLPSHLVNAYLLFLQEQEAKAKSSTSNNKGQTELVSTQIEIEKGNTSMYSNATELNPKDSHRKNREKELLLLKEDSEKRLDSVNPRQELVSDQIKTSEIDSIAQSDTTPPINSSEPVNNNTYTVVTVKAESVFPCPSNYSNSTRASTATVVNTSIPQPYPEENILTSPATKLRTLSTSTPELSDYHPKANYTGILSTASTSPHTTLTTGLKQIPHMGPLNNMNMYTDLHPVGNSISNQGIPSVGYPSLTNTAMFSGINTQSTLTANSQYNPGNVGQNLSSHVGLTGTRPQVPNIMPYSFNSNLGLLNVPANSMNSLGNIPYSKNHPMNNRSPQMPQYYPAYNTNPYVMALAHAATRTKNPPVFMHSMHQMQKETQKIPETKNVSSELHPVVPDNSTAINSQTKSAMTSKERQRLKREKLQKVKLLIEEIRKEQSLNSCMNMKEEA